MPSAADQESAFARRREDMVEDQLLRRDIRDSLVLEAMRRVPRHHFMPQSTWSQAYGDFPVPIGGGQTISQPYIVALMSQLAAVHPGDRVLDVGTGSGYQAAVLCAMGCEVYTVEIVPSHAERSRAIFDAHGFEAIHSRQGDGYEGWPEAAPFEAIVIGAAPTRVPPLLLDQLAMYGRLVLPVGDIEQELIRLTRTPHGFERKRIGAVSFVPMTGKARPQGA